MAKESAGPASSREAAPSTHRVVTARPFVLQPSSTLPLRQWLYGREFIRKFVTVTVATGATGKTLLAIVEALAMATGRDLLGIAPAQPLRVWYFNGEDPLDEMERRATAAAKHYGLRVEEIVDRLLINSGHDGTLVLGVHTSAGVTIVMPVVANIVTEIRRLKIDVLIIDPFVSCHALNENDNAAIDRVAKAWSRIANLTGCAVHLIHHARKTFGAEATVEDSRGASALLAAARIGRVMNAMAKAEADAAGLPSPRGFLRMGHGKSSLALAPDGAAWFRIVSVDLDNGPEGSPGDSVGVVVPWTWPAPNRAVEADSIAAVHSALASGEWRENPQATRWAGKAIAEALGLTLPNDTAKVRDLIKRMLMQGHLKVVESLDAKRMPRTFITPATPEQTEVWQGGAGGAG